MKIELPPRLFSHQCLEKDEFCEVHGSKRFLYVPAKPLTTGSATPFVVKTPQLGTIRCSVVYQGVATRNGATTQEILTIRTGATPNCASTEFSEESKAGMEP